MAQYQPKQLHRIGEIIETFEKKGKPYQKIIKLCSRCQGTGNYSYNQLDGTICYGCYGSGVQVVEERIYTDKEKAAIERAKVKREEKKQSERIAQVEKAEQEKQNKVNKYVQENPITYIVIDKNSYSKKDMLKENKYKWMTWYWVGHIKIEGVEIIEVNTNEVINEYGHIIDTAIKTKVNEYNQKPVVKTEETKSEYQGSTGDKVEIELTYKKHICFETQFGNQHIHIFEDGQGNVYKWKTNKYLSLWIGEEFKCYNEGEKVLIKGTIKGHEDYNGTKQTELTRCKYN